MIRAWTREPRPCPPRARQEGHPRRFTVSHGATGSAPGLCDRRSAGRGHLLMRAGGRVGLMLTSRVYPGGGRRRRLAGGGVPVTDPAPGQGMCAGDRRRSGPWRHGQLGPVRTEGASAMPTSSSAPGDGAISDLPVGQAEANSHRRAPPENAATGHGLDSDQEPPIWTPVRVRCVAVLTAQIWSIRAPVIRAPLPSRVGLHTHGGSRRGIS